MDSVTIVGASVAGLAAIDALRAEGYSGRVVAVGDEPHTPYDRPPLSKQFLDGSWALDRLTLPGVEVDDGLVDWRLGRRAVGLDVAERTVTLDDGTTITSAGVVIATGTRARTLAGTEAMVGVHVLRTLDDARALAADLDATPDRVVVVGAGFIGAEVAATCRAKGLDVTMVEPMPTPLYRALGTTVGNVFAELHRSHGVDVHCGVGVAHLEVDGAGRVSAVVLDDGTRLDASVVVVGIGVIPNTDWLVGSGLDLERDGGVRCDATTRCAPGIVAAGDVASWPNPTFDGERMRVEHWDHAFGQGEHAARALLAGEDAAPYASVPWFWSDQYDRKVQLAGRVAADDEVHVVDGSLDELRFVALYGRAGRLRGVLGLNRPRPVMQLRQQIAEGISLADALATFA